MSAGIISYNQALTDKQILELEKKILTEDKIIFFIRPNGKIGMLAQKPIDSDIDGIAWHKLATINHKSPNEVKELYDRVSSDKWTLEAIFNRPENSDIWTQVETDTSAILGKALLGKMILGRRY